MNVLIFSGSPKHEGLNASCLEAAREGVRQGGSTGEVVRLCEEKLGACAVCGDGWGACREKHVCQFGEDGFTALQQKVAQADAYILVTPVYWGDMTEAMKVFFDRLRRCEALKGEKGAMAGKPVLLVASPGGSGNGMISCLEQMERLARHLHAAVFDFIGVNRWNREYKLEAIRAAASLMVRQK